MRICFIGKGQVADFLKNRNEERADLYLFGFNGLGEVCYEKELQGVTRLFEDAAVLSKTRGGLVVSGCITDTRGHKRKSALIAENGRLLGVSDCLHVMGKELSCGAALRVYETKQGKMGVVVAEDLRFFETLQSLVICGCDFIVCPLGKVTGTMPTVLARAYAYALGIPIFLCAEGYAALISERGILHVSTPISPFYFEYNLNAEYHLIQTRQRGFFSESW